MQEFSIVQTVTLEFTSGQLLNLGILMFALDFSIRRSVSNVVSASRFRLALRMIPPKLNRRSTGADEGTMVF